ncbi:MULTISPECIES: F0F1 ATP synthase subunit A [unclassified Streptomyces]|uniref:F0F1 ATP synthase subunit A n=1 Tax=unclassified Streptomyces TaxID=2593676 RepID=UPI00225541B8|nr:MULTISPECIES: F0F1 ATP synthase subunit A [unclassified Streptomyces]WSP60200.1 F0F1 ATP synthase subunit A [Streptomyces sp. NBC_01241]WSU26400.1 F0F1 ATP synthase subunit A [Streptomyces sp. NBC_01108]MCX4789401.1 F0F1 ATP synthase subunit A [Streptomyces sp. NBC_01221]MCX4794878.1 F0F1 ATP synthase subunit A [Streptomyces sp. NBC_01242]WSJ40978.1 F0F1 ATP synthase subunit A [Streptomyces sp. NBC_01321]
MKEPAVSADPTQVLAFETDCHIFSGCGFPGPGLHSFLFEPIFGDANSNVYFNKTMLLALLGTVIIVGFFWAAFRKPKVVPGKLQMVAEAGYDFVRRGIVYETLGKREGEKYVPLMVSIFFFVWMMNLWSIIPLAQFPVTSVIAYPAALALIVYVLWMSITFKRHGFVGGFKNLTGYDKSLGGVLPLIMVIEFFSNVLVRPFTHAVRLFANMFAGHTLLLLFTIASWYLLNGIGIAYAGVSFVMVIVMTAFELFIQAVQAYVFVLLACTFIQGAVAEHH